MRRRQVSSGKQQAPGYVVSLHLDTSACPGRLQPFYILSALFTSCGL